MSRRPIDIHGCDSHDEVAAILNVETLWPEKQSLSAQLAAQVVLRQRRPLIRQGELVANHRELTGVTSAPQTRYRLRRGLPAPDDHRTSRSCAQGDLNRGG